MKEKLIDASILRVNKKTRKINAIKIVCYVCVLVFIIIAQDGYIEAATWKSAYKKFLSNSNSKVYGMSIKDYEGNIKFGIEDIDSNGIPELIFDMTSFYGDSCPKIIYTYKKGKVKCVDESGYKGEIYKFQNSKLFMIKYEKWGSVFITYNSYYKLSNGKLRLVAGEIVDHGSDGTKKISEYLIGNKKCSKQKFTKYIRKNKCIGKKKDVVAKYSITEENIIKIIE